MFGGSYDFIFIYCCRSPDKDNSCVNIASDVNDVIDVDDGNVRNDVDDGNDGNDEDDGNDGNDEDAKNDGDDPPSSTLPPVSKCYFFVVLFSFHILLSS